MIERDHGHVIGICSMAGKVGVKGLVDYCASKFGAVGFMEALRAEFRHRSKNLHVTLVCPYYINTGMFDGVVSSSPYLLPILNVDYVADRTIEAVATNQTVLYLPRFCYWTMIIKELLPTAAAERIGHLVGVDKELNGFYAKKTQPLKA
jgi:all-trans-retinol dehydrogenase (NAD+)